MSEQDPIVLPGLAAERRGPTAAVCTSGHVYAWLLEPETETGYCPKCGDAILVACPSCGEGLPPDPSMLQWVPYHAFCVGCGRPYPWTQTELSKAKRTFAERAEVDRWDDTVKSRAAELVDDIAGERATASAVVAAIAWLEQHGAEHATPAILDLIDKLGSANLKTALRPHFPGTF